MTQIILVTRSAPLSECLVRFLSDCPLWHSTHVVDSADALDAMAASVPSVVVVDDDLTDGSTASEVCRRLRASSQSIGLIVTTSSKKVDERLLAFDSGADDCLVKPFDARELWARIQALARRSAGNGRPDLAEPRLAPWRPGDALELRTIAIAARYRLSDREKEILLHMVRGIHLKEIGGRVGCAYSSVRTYVRRMATKLACSGSRELVLKFFADEVAGRRASVRQATTGRGFPPPPASPASLRRRRQVAPA